MPGKKKSGNASRREPVCRGTEMENSRMFSFLKDAQNESETVNKSTSWTGDSAQGVSLIKETQVKELWMAYGRKSLSYGEQ